MAGQDNIEFKFADITNLEFEDNSFDKVIAGNVIHLLDEPEKALNELKRVVKPGGVIIIPTYLIKANKLASIIDKMGANFRRKFDMESYQKFFSDMGYNDVRYEIADGTIPCAVAMIRC